MCKKTLADYNGVHMTTNEKFVYGFSLTALQGISMRKLMSKFRAERRLRQTNQDFLNNDCQPVVDGDKQMLLTGCDVSANILRTLIGLKPKIVAYPIWFHSLYLIFEIQFSRMGFFFCKKSKIHIIMPSKIL